MVFMPRSRPDDRACPEQESTRFLLASFAIKTLPARTLPTTMPPKPAENGRMKVSFETVTDDRACAGCGYSLKGLPVTGRCPECGAEITASAGNYARRRRLVGRGTSLGDAPSGFLVPFGLALAGLGISGPAMIVLIPLGLPVGFNPVFAVVAALVAFVWVGSCLVLLRPRPRPKDAAALDRDAPRSGEWRMLRLSVAMTQPMALVLVGVLAHRFANDSPLHIAGQWTAVSILVLGLVPLALLLANFADWAGDTPMLARLRTLAWVLGAAPIVGFGIHYLSRAHVAFTMLFWVEALCFLGWFVSLLLMCFSALQMVAMTRWAVINRREAQARDARVLERARAAGVPGGMAAAIEAGVPLATGGIAGGFGPRAPEADTEPHSLLPPPGTPRAGDRSTLRIEPTTDSPYALEDTSPNDP